MQLDMLIDILKKLLGKSSVTRHPQPLRVINEPDGIIVARKLTVEDLKRYMYETSDFLKDGQRDLVN